jgi:hypothetical protein
VTSARAPRTARRAKGLVLRLDAGIYPEVALERTRRAFAHLAAIEVRGGGRWWTIRFTSVNPGVGERLADEFANHVLSCAMVDR